MSAPLIRNPPKFAGFPKLLIGISFNPHLQVAPPTRSRACFVS